MFVRLNLENWILSLFYVYEVVPYRSISIGLHSGVL